MDNSGSIFLHDRYGSERQMACEGQLRVFRTRENSQTAVGVLRIPDGNDLEAALYASDALSASGDQAAQPALFTGKVATLSGDTVIDAVNFHVSVRGFRHDGEILVEGNFLAYMASAQPTWA